LEASVPRDLAFEASIVTVRKTGGVLQAGPALQPDQGRFPCLAGDPLKGDLPGETLRRVVASFHPRKKSSFEVDPKHMGRAFEALVGPYNSLQFLLVAGTEIDGSPVVSGGWVLTFEALALKMIALPGMAVSGSRLVGGGPVGERPVGGRPVRR
jgi:hypothetical protein